MNKPLFLTFEGIDGCGKSTQLALLAERLRGEGHEVVETIEPGGTAVGQAVRSVLLDPRYTGMSSRAELLLYFASRAQNVSEIIAPALARGAYVLCDRFTDSTIVYQGAGRGLDHQTILDLHRISCGPIQPDCTFLLDVDLETSLARARRRDLAAQSRETRIENETLAFFKRVADGYRRLARSEPDRITTIDARHSVSEVAERIWAALASNPVAQHV